MLSWHNTCSQHKLPCLVLHGLQKPISFRPVDVATSLFTILLLPRIYLGFLFLLYAIMGGLLKDFAIFELMLRMFQFLCSILPIGGSGLL